MQDFVGSPFPGMKQKGTYHEPQKSDTKQIEPKLVFVAFLSRVPVGFVGHTILSQLYREVKCRNCSKAKVALCMQALALICAIFPLSRKPRHAQIIYWVPKEQSQRAAEEKPNIAK